MFRGINAVNLDPKGRIAIPTRYREQLCGSAGSAEVQTASLLVFTIDTQSSCLLMYPLAEWEVIEQKVAALSSFNPETRRLQRLVIGHATEAEPDAQGRVLIPPVLREYANLTKKVMLVGQRNKFEIWDDHTWTEERYRWLAEEASAKNTTPSQELQDLTL